MAKIELPRLSVNPTPPYDLLQAFVRHNHIALKGMDSGPLNGLVFAIKDVWKVIGSTCGNGHPDWLRTHGPDEMTSSIVTRLLDAGADMVGKTVCDELCFSISGENWHYGSPINPHDPLRYTGGSSAGSGAATAGGLVDFALGSDCLGSVRVPSSYNGLLGSRPTYQRVPGDGEAPFCASMDVVGFMASDPEVFKRVGKVMLGEDTIEGKPRKLLVAQDCFAAVNSDVAAALKPAVKSVAAEVGTVENITVSPEGLDKWVEIFRFIQGYEVWESYGGFIDKVKPQLSPGPKERLEWASTVTRQQYSDSLAARQDIIKRVDSLLQQGSIVCLPTVASVAPLKGTPVSELSATRLQSTSLLCISPLCGIPQLTLPLVKQHDVPLGLTLIGARNTDLQLAEFAADVVKTHVEK